ncbi:MULTISPECIES: acyl-CoA dehydrogenase family protein [Pseudomonadota]|jgi:acyl-CoA dehydrogenase|uniref:acyl-CoA dehydrogenase family protein n=1 Tax=Pseudomonadota TaxID=1224 RepID=UPI000C6A2E75|nr:MULTISPECIES: acyl-CoA dehydrogenase family protein [Pseudomonadota]MAA60434.1 acyl-CoA dehydrogenase [Pseudomonadales bacterium]MEC8810051.1 acyl-CoA dehydrogenase family protein [Pseudomonadota bacterium]TNC84480.1 MAG: acyl-CoA dehydrogenase [Alcanivorax sp.]HAU14100.1 acyl-CoA dehydrogenase [Gammaproteobacteria bacterium]MAQ24679.1 acyl-CoA dehydrogenase [Pseudomonadales bacterium]|tara:strand:+ start:657 stop:1823 length:1167 start_codon:yes stop_codon:yes gene_type:complete
MDFSFTDDQQNIRDAVLKHCSQFNDDYWLERDREGIFPHDFHRSMAESGWLGIAMPEANGGSGLGITEAAIMMQAVAESGGGMTAASSIHGPVFSMQPVQLFGSDEQRQRMIPPVIRGDDLICFAVTEPNTGLDTTKLKTRAEKREGGYLINGEKIWISVAKVANKMMLLARTTPLADVTRKTDGLTLFFTDIDPTKVEVRTIHKMGRHAVDSNMLFISDLWIPEADRIGAEGEGFKIILHGLNPERILLGAEAIGLGRAALHKAARYANERIVFDRPIGMNQGIQHPLAKCWAQLEAANLMVMKGANLFDKGKDCGIEANAGKYLAAEAGFEACHTAMLTLGGMGYAQEYHVERYLREILIPRTAPVSPHMILNFLAEKALGLPKSY